MLYKELREMPIPSFAFISQTDGRVFEFLEEEGKPLNKCKRRSIGKATSKTHMIPNSNFRSFHSDLWKQYYGENEISPSRIVVKAGLYASVLSISHKLRLYDALIDTVGVTSANSILDYAMYQMSTHSNVAMTYEEHMDRYIQFSQEIHSDTWWSNFFHTKLPDDKIDRFTSKWLDICKNAGIKEAYLSIDGSNFDCNVEKCELAEQGKAKSKNQDSKLIGTITAVDAVTGMPILYSIFNGGKVDCKSVVKIVMRLKNHGIAVKGIILDRGFCFNNVLDALGDTYDYILMLHSDTFGHVEMMQKYLETIRWNVNYSICGRALFGIEQKQKLFKSSDREAFVNLFFDGINAGERSETLIMKVLGAMNEIQHKIDQKQADITIPKEVQKYLSIKEVKDEKTIVCNYKQWQQDIDEKGFYSIASSKQLGPEEVYRRYHLRDASETGYAILKTQLGERVLRAHTTDSIEGKIFIGFIASIIRNYFMNTCQEEGLDTNQMIGEISRLQFLSNEHDVYSFVEDTSIRQRKLMGALDLSTETMKQLANEYSGRKNPISSLIRKFPENVTSEYKRRKRGGRKPGSLNKKTLEKIAQEQKQKMANEQKQSDNKAVSTKRGPGRPKGSLNKSTLLKMEQEKRKPGRPKGSRGKKFTSIQKSHKKGRPLGSKNKKTLVKMAADQNPKSAKNQSDTTKD